MKDNGQRPNARRNTASAEPEASPIEDLRRLACLAPAVGAITHGVRKRPVFGLAREMARTERVRGAVFGGERAASAMRRP